MYTYDLLFFFLLLFNIYLCVYLFIYFLFSFLFNIFFYLFFYLFIPEGNNVFTATIRSKDFNSKRGLKLKSNSSREELGTNFNNKYNLPSQTQFLENSCEIGIEKFANGNATEFIATVRNCPSTDQLKVRKSLYVTVRDRYGDAALVWSGNPFGHYKDDNIFDYHKYVRLYYKGSEKDVHYAVLNFPAMKDDGITLVNFWFMLTFSELSPYQEASMVAPFRVWSYNL